MTNMGIEAFLAICRHKNISKAADELYITQASLSARLKALEEELAGLMLQIPPDQEKIEEVNTKEWLERCSFPIGMDNDGNLWGLDD